MSTKEQLFKKLRIGRYVYYYHRDAEISVPTGVSFHDWSMRNAECIVDTNKNAFTKIPNGKMASEDFADDFFFFVERSEKMNNEKNEQKENHGCKFVTTDGEKDES